MPPARRPLLALLLSLVLLLSGGLPATAASTLEQRLEGWPTWSLPAPLPRPGARDLFYPSWFEGDWVATSADLSGVEPEIEYAVRFIQDPSGRIVGDRAFNANSVGRALLGEQLQRVRNDPQNPNRQLADLSGDRYLESTVVGRRSEQPLMDQFLADELSLQVLHGPGDPRVSQVETLSRYVRINADRIEAQQWQVSYDSPSEGLIAEAKAAPERNAAAGAAALGRPNWTQAIAPEPERFQTGIVGQARHATARQGTTGRAGELDQGQLGHHRQIRQGELISHQIGLGMHEGRELLEAAAQLLQNLLVKHLTDTTQHPTGQCAHEGAQRGWGGLRQQAIPQHRIAGCRLHQSHPRSSRQGGVGPVLQQKHLGPLGGIAGEQCRIGMLLLQMQRDGRGVRDYLAAIDEDRHLPLAGEPVEVDLTDSGGDLHRREAELLEGQHQADLLAEGGMAELMELQHQEIKSRGNGCPLAAE